MCPYAIVIAVGPGTYDEKKGFSPIRALKAGDKVVVAPKAGTLVDINGESYIILIHTQVEAICIEDDA